MLPYMIGLTTLGTVKPYVRQHVLRSLDPHDYMFLNSLFITLFVLIYFGYKCVFQDHSVKKIYSTCMDLSWSQMCALIILSLLTVISSLVFFNVEKYFNTPFINNVLLRALSMIALFLVGVFVFEERYHPSHIVGIGLTVAGILVFLYNPI